MGTGGAIKKALPLLGQEFLVTYGDSYLDTPYRPVVDAFRRAGKPGLMTVFHNAGRWDTSNVEFADGRILAHSKQPTPRMKHIDYGLSIFRRDAFDGTPDNAAFDLASVSSRLVQNDQMAGYEVTTRFYEIGSAAGLAETDAYLRARYERLPQ